MLEDAHQVAFVGVSDLDAAQRFYGDLLGLDLEDARPYALVHETSQSRLRVTLVDEVRAPPYTVLGWIVADLELLPGDLPGRSGVTHAGPPVAECLAEVFVVDGLAREVRVWPASHIPADRAPWSSATSSATANTSARSAVSRVSAVVSWTSNTTLASVERYIGSVPATSSRTPDRVFATVSRGCSADGPGVIDIPIPHQ